MGANNYRRFEDLNVWKKTAKLSVEIYRTLKFLKDFFFLDHISKTSLSIFSNIAEGFERRSHKESIKFLIHGKGFCGELRSQIYIGIEIDYIDLKIGERWIDKTCKIS